MSWFDLIWRQGGPRRERKKISHFDSKKMLKGIVAACALSVASAAGDAPKDAGKLVTSAERELRNGNTDASLKLFAEALSLKPDPKTYYSRHKAWLKKGKLPAAITDLTSAINGDAGYAMAYLQRANLQLNVGRCAEAAEDYQATLRLDPNKRDAQSRLPQALTCASALQRAREAAAHHNWNGAVDALNEALGQEQVVQAPGLLLDRARARLSLGQLEEALGDGAKVLKLEPNNPPAYALRGKALYLHSDYATAKVHFQECTRYDPDYKECRDGYKLVKAVLSAKERGDAAANEGRWADAAEIYSAGSTLDMANGAWLSDVLPKVAKAHVKTKAYAAAKEAGERCLSILGDHQPDCHLWLGEAFLGLGACPQERAYS